MTVRDVAWCALEGMDSANLTELVVKLIQARVPVLKPTSVGCLHNATTMLYEVYYNLPDWAKAYILERFDYDSM